MRFKRNTHDSSGNLRPDLPSVREDGYGWPTCCIHLLTNEPMTLQEIYDAHVAYDKQYGADGFGFTLPDVLEGLAHMIRLSLVRVDLL